jgi:glycosyltransferase involved in cell wall biosynthesis
MKEELCSAFRIPAANVSVIALGVNNTVPNTDLSPADARARIGLGPDERVLLFFGRISPYKGLEYLLSALERIPNPGYRLLIIGSVQNFPDYWSGIQQRIQASGLGARIIQRIEFIPDEDTELYFKAADVLILPYVNIFQSGVLVLAYSFGLPVIAADVGSLGKEVVPGITGYVFRSRDSDHLAETITHYFSSPLFRDLSVHREVIRAHVNRVYSWEPVGAASEQVYRSLQPCAR